MRPPLKACPITASMGALGKKWTLLLMRDMLVYGHDRFGAFQRSTGLSPRMLSKRLDELVADGFVEKDGEGRQTRYRPTPKGLAVAPLLEAAIGFGIRHHADQVFWDGEPRTTETFRSMMEEHGVRFWSLTSRSLDPSWASKP